MTDKEIIQALKDFDEAATKKYFYGYCRTAYSIYDRKYQLRGKVGLDFYSLAHEYYIQLMTHNFSQLEDHSKDVALSSWIIGGFRYVVLDALKAYRKEFDHQSSAVCDDVLEFVRSSEKDEGLMMDVAEAVASHYNDRKMQELAYEIFVLGYKQNEVSKQLGLTPSAINQRYKKMMDEVVTPFVLENYAGGIYYGKSCDCGIMADVCLSAEAMPMENIMCKNKIFMENETIDNKERITPEFIRSLKPNEIFVFGSNLHGIHAGGAARAALMYFGAEMGNGIGIQGQSYAIPTMQGGVETIAPYVDDFVEYAKQHPEKNFLVTPIGCGIAGFDPEEIAPLFEKATELENVWLPESFWEWL